MPNLFETYPRIDHQAVSRRNYNIRAIPELLSKKKELKVIKFSRHAVYIFNSGAQYDVAMSSEPELCISHVCQPQHQNKKAQSIFLHSTGSLNN